MSADQYRNDDPYRPSAPPPAPGPGWWPAPTGHPVAGGGPEAARLNPEESDATRYLCAAPHLDDRFAQLVLDEVMHQPRRAVAPSFGFSLGPVIRHCLAARRRTLIRDAVVTALLLLGLLLAFRAGVTVLLGFLGLWLLARGIRLLRARQTAPGLVHLLFAALLAPLVIGALLASILQALGLSLLLGLLGYPGFGTSGGLGGMWVLILLGVWGTYFAHRLVVHHMIAVELTPQQYDPGRSPAVNAAQAARLAQVEQAQRGNLTIYSEEASGRPFIGFGRVDAAFSLVTPLMAVGESGGDGRSSATGPTGLPFSIDELYESLRSGLAALSDDRLPRDEVVPHLSVHDHVFVAGRLPAHSGYVAGGQPRSHLTSEERLQLQHTERGRVRHYQTVRLSAWSGELEVTIFVHLAVRGRMLFAEFVATVVPGIRSAYHRIDTYDQLDATAVLRAAGSACGDLVRSPVAIGRLARAGWQALRRAVAASATDQRISRQLAFDYGCRASVRELAADFADPVQFQLYDAGERISVVQRRMLQTVVQFLVEHGYDTADIAGQATTVINNSTQITNSNTFANSTIVGSAVVAGNSAAASAVAAPRSPSGTPAPSSPPPGRPAPRG
jgi:hypothetical protein